MTLKRSNLILGLAFLLVFFLTQWNHWSGALERDEGEYAYAAQLLRTGGMPYTQSFLQKPPVIIYLYLFAQVISDSPVLPIRLLASLFLLATIALTAWIAWKRCGKTAATAVLFFLPVMLANPFLYSFAANTEKFMILPMMGVLALSTYHPGFVPFNRAVLAGILAGMALLIKPICLPLLACMFIFWIWQLLQKSPQLSALLLPVSGWVVGFCATSLFLLLPIIGGGAWADMWQCTITFNRYYAESMGLPVQQFFSIFSDILRQGWPLLILLLTLPFVRYDQRWQDVALLLSGCLSLIGSVHGHYHIMLIPIWVLISSCLLQYLLQTRLPVPFQSQTGMCSGLAIAVISLLLLWPIREQLITSSEDLYFRAYSGNPFYESPLVAQQVARLTGPEEKIFIAGSEPQILYYAQRKSLTRFVIMYPLMIDTPLAYSFQQQLISELDRTMPSVIVWSTSNNSWLMSSASPPILLPYLQQLLKQSYSLQGGWIREGMEKGRWKDVITDAEKKIATILVYKRKG